MALSASHWQKIITQCRTEYLKKDSVHQVASANTNVQTRIGPADAATYQQIAYSQPSTLAQVQAKEADVQALAELTRALDKKRSLPQ
ncbi:UNVERIFIED_CONTAM: protein ALWAYS EARLY 3 [Sesamum radiatum]|uniref:Protein ALWAYS EARLY 3 n=1 Tax=Sesamum radiatum TaxID=300843 RepID=A0AAW2UC50_SESRA